MAFAEAVSPEEQCQRGAGQIKWCCSTKWLGRKRSGDSLQRMQNRASTRFLSACSDFRVKSGLDPLGWQHEPRPREIRSEYVLFMSG